MKNEFNMTKCLRITGLCLLLSIFAALFGFVSSVAVDGVPARPECPCNYFSVPQLTECWVDPFTPPKVPTFSSNIPPPPAQAAVCEILISDMVEPFETIQLQASETTGGNKVCQINISDLPPECGPQAVFVQGLTVEQYEACQCELQAYATALSQVEGIGVVGGPPYMCSEVECEPPLEVLDPSFSFDGKVTTSFGFSSNESARGVVVQSDGKIVAAGTSDADGSLDFALAGYNTEGGLDDSFGSAGLVLTDFSGGGSDDEAFAFTIQSDGKVVAAGISDANGSSDFALARYNPNGSLDNSFGGVNLLKENSDGGLTGEVLTDFSGSGSDDEAHALSIQSDGKIVTAGNSDADGSLDFALARYNPDGSLDNSFGSAGLVLTDFSGPDLALALSIQSDGKIVAAGESGAEGSFDFALARYNPDGSLDNSFGSAGLVLTDFSGSGSNDQAAALIIQSDGKILAAGASDADGSLDFALARYNPDGSLDNSFGSAGLVLTDFSGSGSFDVVEALTVQSDGKILAAGASDADGSLDFALARYNPDGSLDNSFGSAGLILTDFSGGISLDQASALTIQSDGKIVAAGRSNVSGNESFALARYLGSISTPTPTPSPTATPTPTPTPTITPTPGAPQAGDANGDGVINILDVTAILNHILVISPASGNGDCNEDGQANILDVTCVLNIILGP